MATQSAPRFVKWAVLLGIVIALNIFFLVARSVVFPEPKYDDFCPTRVQPANTETACVAQDGVWVKDALPTPAPDKISDAEMNKYQGYCDLYQKCQPLYDAAQKQFRLYAFIIMTGLGILSLIVGVLPIGSSIVSSGLSYGGVLALIISAIQYWNDASSWIQLGMATLALGALLYIGIKRFRD